MSIYIKKFVSLLVLFVTSIVPSVVVAQGTATVGPITTPRGLFSRNQVEDLRQPILRMFIEKLERENESNLKEIKTSRYELQTYFSDHTPEELKKSITLLEKNIADRKLIIDQIKNASAAAPTPRVLPNSTPPQKPRVDYFAGKLPEILKKREAGYPTLRLDRLLQLNEQGSIDLHIFDSTTVSEGSSEIKIDGKVTPFSDIEKKFPIKKVQ